MCVCRLRIDPLHFLARCRRRRLNQGLVVALDFLLLLDMACFVLFFLVYGCMLCLVRYLFVISNWLPWKIRPRNDLLCVEWDVKPCWTQTTSNGAQFQSNPSLIQIIQTTWNTDKITIPVRYRYLVANWSSIVSVSTQMLVTENNKAILLMVHWPLIRFRAADFND